MEISLNYVLDEISKVEEKEDIMEIIEDIYDKLGISKKKDSEMTLKKTKHLPTFCLFLYSIKRSS